MATPNEEIARFTAVASSDTVIVTNFVRTLNGLDQTVTLNATTDLLVATSTVSNAITIDMTSNVPRTTDLLSSSEYVSSVNGLFGAPTIATSTDFSVANSTVTGTITISPTSNIPRTTDILGSSEYVSAVNSIFGTVTIQGTSDFTVSASTVTGIIQLTPTTNLTNTEVVNARNSSTFTQAFSDIDARFEYDETKIKNIETASRTTDVTVQSPANSYSTSALPGLVKGTISGRSFVNSVVNGNFVNTTGWTNLDSTHSASGNTLSNTGTGVTSFPRTYKTTPIVLSSGKKIYIRANIRVTNSVCSSFGVYTNGTSGAISVIGQKTSPVQNQWYLSSGILTVTTEVGPLDLRLRHDYADAATANGKVMEVRDVIAIDLDAHGLTTKTTAELDAMSDAYFDSLKSVENLIITSEGKNIFGGALESGTIDTSGANAVDAATIRSAGFTKCKGATAYYLSNALSYAVVRICAYDSGQNFISVVTNGIATPSNARYLRFAFTGTSVDTATVKAQLEEGTGQTTYEPYQFNKITTNPILRWVPSGVRDTVIIPDIGESFYTKYVGVASYSSGIIISSTVFTDASTSASYLVASTAGNAQGGTMNSTEVATFSGTIQYQLATPVTKSLGMQTLTAFKNGRFYTNTAVVPSITYNLPANIAEQINNTLTIAEDNEDRISNSIFSLPLINGQYTITNIGSTIAELTGYRTKYDLSYRNETRVVAYVGTAANSSGELRVQYSTSDATASTDWDYLDGSSGPILAIGTTGTIASTWFVLDSTARNDVYIRVVSINGDGAADPVFYNLQLQSK